MARLAAYDWPGNVRELQNVIERAVVLAQGPVLDFATELVSRTEPTTPNSAHVAPAPLAATDRQALDEVSRQHIVAVLKQTGWRIDGPRGAARLLKLHPSTLRSRMQKLGIRRSAAELS